MSKIILKLIQLDGKSYFHVYDKQNAPIENANKFLRAIELRGLSKHTMRAYGYDLVIFYRWLDGFGKSFEDLYIADLFEFIDIQRKQNIHASSINRRLITIRVFYSFCFDREMPRGNGVSDPASYYRGQGWDRQLGVIRVQRPGRLKLRLKTARKIVESLKPIEVNNFLRKVERYRDLAIYLFMLYCGLRSCEVLSLKMESLNWDESMVRIFGKGQKERMMPMPNQIQVILKKYIQFERPEFKDQRSLFLVLDKPNRGQPMTPEGLRSLFRHRRRISKITHANPHRLRHTFGLEMAKSRVRLPVLQKMMGHANPETTLRYINLSMVDVAEEFDRASKEIQKRYDKK